MGDTIVINSAYIPIKKEYPDLKPTACFAADSPKRALPDEWLEDEEILCVLNNRHATNLSQIGRSNNIETWESEKNASWSSNPFVKEKIQGPYKSTLLCYQWAHKKGYKKIAFYANDCKDYGKYAGSKVELTDLESYGRGFSYRDILFCLDAWSRHAVYRNEPYHEVINLSPESLMRNMPMVTQTTVGKLFKERM
jgi:hypothetical protein